MINLLNKLPILKIKDKLDLVKLDNKKIFLLVLVSLLILYIDFTSIIKLQLKAINSLTPKITKLKRDINNLAIDLKTIQDLKNIKTPDKQRVGVAGAKKIISEDEIPLLLQTISDIANKNKVKIIQINTAGYTKAQEEIIVGEKLSSISIKLDLSGNYHSLGSFINNFENASQFMELQEMKIVRSPSDYFIENASLVLKVYVRK
jgi:Tfp pilus assembly protein PilO